MREHLQAKLKAYFGHTSFRPGQEEVVSRLLQGKSVLGLLATGGGKSITYQLPALLLPGITVVVSPLISLMVDQVQQLRSQKRIPAAYLNSAQDPREARETLRELEQGVYKLLYISPERLQQPYVQSVLRRVGVSLFAVDEAHCISQWGHDFRTDYMRLPEVAKRLGNPPVLAVTATATAEVQEEICQLFAIQPENVVALPVNRDNIALDVIHAATEAERRMQVIELMNALAGPGIVYCSTRQAVEVLVASYQLEGRKRIHGYHGGMSSMERMLIQSQYVAGELDIIVATNAFGMGIDKADIRYVIHCQMPASLEAYAQEIGRVGRDGKPGYAALFAVWDDVQIHQHMIEREYPTREQLQQYCLLLAARTPLSPEHLAALGMTEEMADLLAFYAEKAGLLLPDGETAAVPDHLSVADEIMRELQSRKQRKEKKLADIVRFIQERNQCLRKRLNGYFGDGEHTFTSQCCSYCGLSREMYMETSSSGQVDVEVPWDLRQALTRLLPNL